MRTDLHCAKSEYKIFEIQNLNNTGAESENGIFEKSKIAQHCLEFNSKLINKALNQSIFWRPNISEKLGPICRFSEKMWASQIYWYVLRRVRPRADWHCTKFCWRKCCLCMPLFALKENIKFKKTQIFLLAFYRAYHGAEKNFSNLKFEYLSENELFNKTTV